MSFLQKLAKRERPKTQMSELAAHYLDAVSGGFGDDDLGADGGFMSAMDLDAEMAKNKKKVYLQVCGFRQYRQTSFDQQNVIYCPI